MTTPTRPARLLFDLMDTLIADPYRQAHEAATGLTFAQFEKLRPWGVYYDLERGLIAEGHYWRRLRECGVTIDPAVFHRVRRAGYRWLAGMRELLDECRDLVPTSVASNYPEWIDGIFGSMPGLRGIPYFASCQCGSRKPSTQYFEALAATTGTAIADMVLVDDKESNVEAFRRMGGRGVCFQGAADTRKQLAALGIPVGAP